MDDDRTLSFSAHLLIAVAGVAAAGIALLAPGVPAVIGAFVAVVCFLATAAPEGGCDTSHERCLIETLVMARQPEPMPAEEVETGMYWQERVTVPEVSQRMH